MPPPFPGIDPYIEGQGRWRDFHTSFNTYLRDALSDRLPDDYEAVLEERFVLLSNEEQQAVYADVGVVRMPGGPAAVRAAEGTGGGAAVIEPVTIPHRIVAPEPERIVSVEIRRFPDRELVAVIELLSPTNKLAGAGRNEYLGRRRQLLLQDIHLIELDFLLEGPRLPMKRPLPAGDAYAFVSRADRRPDCDVYAWPLRSALPEIPVPLRGPDPDVRLDLAAVYAKTHELGRYARRLKYGEPLNLPLDPATLSWAEGKPDEAR